MLVKAPKMEMKGEWPGDSDGRGWGAGLARVSRALKTEVKEWGSADTERKLSMFAQDHAQDILQTWYLQSPITVKRHQATNPNL